MILCSGGIGTEMHQNVSKACANMFEGSLSHGRDEARPEMLRSTLSKRTLVAAPNMESRHLCGTDGADGAFPHIVLALLGSILIRLWARWWRSRALGMLYRAKQ